MLTDTAAISDSSDNIYLYTSYNHRYFIKLDSNLNILVVKVELNYSY